MQATLLCTHAFFSRGITFSLTPFRDSDNADATHEGYVLPMAEGYTA